MQSKAMITLFVEENNPLTPNFYNNLIINLQFHQLTCPCDHSGGLSVHGYYNRSVKLLGGKVTFRICRVICEHCGHTHAILLSSMVPYSQVSTSDHISVINNYNQGTSQEAIMNANPCSFLLEIDRRVSSDSVITIDQIEYEVDCRFAKQRIKLRYSPDFKDIFIVEADGTLTPIRLLNKTENAFVKREKIHLCRGEE